MKAGIFAAGVGARLGGPARGPKALTPLAGRPLIDWVLEDLDRAAVTDVVVIINEESIAVREHVTRHPPRAAIRWIVETTASSMHSFFRIVEDLARDGDAGPFLASTVDTIAPAGTFAAFVDRASALLPDADAVLALTARVEDDKPFRVRLADGAARSGAVAALGQGPFATAGYSLVRPSVLRDADAARAARVGALRDYFVRLLAGGFRFAGVCMAESIDVDRDADVTAAERLLRKTVC
ncbi:MAG TPA: NDP-sugar synthase [Vicinamibacterales bacterium]|nr:NDP-sugar synthase [Vicinamibacterales bacterium]